MPMIKSKRRVVQASTSTHDGNETKKFKIDDQSDSDLMNHMDVDTLIDPEDYTGGSTHTSVSASRKIKAGDDCEDQNVGTLDRDIDPAAGYLENASEELDDDEDDEVQASEEFVGLDQGDGDTLENNNAHTPLTEASVAGEGEDADWDAQPEGDEEDDADVEDQDVEDDETEGDEDDVATAGEGDESGDDEITPDSMPLVDVDETDDLATANVAFASFGTKLLVIKANRIVATMSADRAIKAGRHEVYLSDQFQEVTASQMEKLGMRKGLKTQGFVLTRVSLAKASVVNAQADLKASKLTAAVRQVESDKKRAFEQSLAIAAVGINRSFFNDVPNELRAHLESELVRAGLKGAQKFLARAFASYGPSYAKSVVDLATKISAMPKESRNSFVAALDMTSENMEVEDAGDEDVPIGEAGGGADSNEEDNEFMDDSVSATLATAGVRRAAQAITAGNYSLLAQDILSGKRPMFGI